MIPRDVVKLAFQFQEQREIPFRFAISPEQAASLTAHYGDEAWRTWAPPYIQQIAGVDNFLKLSGMERLPNGYERDCLGCVWNMGSTHHLVAGPLKEPSLQGYQLPDMKQYVAQYLKPLWPAQIAESQGGFRVSGHSFGLFERAWSLRGFENFNMDLQLNPAFCDELLELLTEWMLESIDALLGAPLDMLMLTDDYADQRGMIFGLDKWRRFFKPHYRRLFARIRKAGVYSALHVCGNAAPAVPDLIECGLDCLESLQPEAMDVYKLKREYGRDLRLWGGLGCQSTLLSTPAAVRQEVRRLKRELGKGGGYILNGAKGIMEDTPVPNVIAYLEEARSGDY
jgi:uroporphyrinogen decarboxylase